MKKKNKHKRASQRTDTLIGPGSEMEGVLQCEDNLRIDGRFNGSIESQGCVTIGEEAIARSNISAREVIVAGKVYGDVTAESRLTITPTGQMYGDVYAASLIVMEGGLLNGASRMEEQNSTQTTLESKETALPVQRSEAG
ncbi:bactofilin family protein [Paenibacillus solani]|uniref:Cell division protein n=1 Tax=Paenibacillus solani TaxID=1705565 RepID=A0A0M1NKU5_9BACL|nr:polymer-forming cytoskeletal protein [Paenibacillus solani]KOR82499.1 cell division protein [Paenibacillus solani]